MCPYNLFYHLRAPRSHHCHEQVGAASIQSEDPSIANPHCPKTTNNEQLYNIQYNNILAMYQVNIIQCIWNLRSLHSNGGIRPAGERLQLGRPVRRIGYTGRRIGPTPPNILWRARIEAGLLLCHSRLCRVRCGGEQKHNISEYTRMRFSSSVSLTMRYLNLILTSKLEREIGWCN